MAFALLLFLYRVGCCRKNNNPLSDEAWRDGSNNTNNRWEKATKVFVPSIPLKYYYTQVRSRLEATRTILGPRPLDPNLILVYYWLSGNNCPILSTGFNVETVRHKNLDITMWDVGGRDKMVIDCHRSKFLIHRVQWNVRTFCPCWPVASTLTCPHINRPAKNNTGQCLQKWNLSLHLRPKSIHHEPADEC